MTSCRFVSSSEPRVVAGRHAVPCTCDDRELGISSNRCAIMSEAGRCGNTPRPLTRSLDLSKEGLAMNATSTPRPCSVEGCEKNAKNGSRQLCPMHYSRLHRTGSLEKRVRAETCVAEGCDRPVRTADLCSSHYVQKQASERPDRICEVDGCDKLLAKTSTRKICEVHYRRMRLHGSYDKPVRVYQKDTSCCVDDCERTAQNRGFCGMHAERIRHNGDPHTVRVIIGKPEERFWAKVDKQAGQPCWLWTGWVAENGYGRFSIGGGKQIPAHRFSYELHKGPVPDGLTIDHVYDWGCRNKHCVNPDHLEVVTQLENSRRYYASIAGTA